MTEKGKKPLIIILGLIGGFCGLIYPIVAIKFLGNTPELIILTLLAMGLEIFGFVGGYCKSEMEKQDALNVDGEVKG